MVTNTDDFLAHFGVKGMKWGVRKGSSGSSPGDTHAKEPPSSDALTALAAKSKAKTHGLASLSNKEIQDLVTRTNLEAQYSKMNPSKVVKGRTKVNDVLTTANVGITLYNTFKSPAVQATIKAVKTAIDTVPK